MKKEGLTITSQDQVNFRQYENEYESMIDILSNFGQEKIIDCLQENIDLHSNDQDFITCTYGDMCQNDTGEDFPRELGLTNPGEFGVKQRLDYIFVLDQGDNQVDGI